MLNGELSFSLVKSLAAVETHESCQKKHLVVMLLLDL